MAQLRRHDDQTICSFRAVWHCKNLIRSESLPTEPWSCPLAHPSSVQLSSPGLKRGASHGSSALAYLKAPGAPGPPFAWGQEALGWVASVVHFVRPLAVGPAGVFGSLACWPAGCWLVVWSSWVRWLIFFSACWLLAVAAGLVRGSRRSRHESLFFRLGRWSSGLAGSLFAGLAWTWGSARASASTSTSTSPAAFSTIFSTTSPPPPKLRFRQSHPYHHDLPQPPLYQASELPQLLPPVPLFPTQALLFLFLACLLLLASSIHLLDILVFHPLSNHPASSPSLLLARAAIPHPILCFLCTPHHRRLHACVSPSLCFSLSLAARSLHSSCFTACILTVQLSGLGNPPKIKSARYCMFTIRKRRATTLTTYSRPICG